MALGTISDVTGGTYVTGNKRIRIRDVQCTSGANYTTGGESVTPASVKLNRIIAANIISPPTVSDGSAHRICTVLYQTDGSVKLVYGGAAAGAQVAGNTDLSTYTVRIEFIGT